MPITDLTGTKWRLNTTFTTIPSGQTFSQLDDDNEIYTLNFTSNKTNYIQLVFVGTGYSPSGINYYYNNIPISQRGVWDYYTNAWKNQELRDIEITGGTDVTNATLIAWLEANATQIIEPSTSPVPSSFKSIAITEHETYITLEFNGEEYDLELSSPLSSPSASKIVFGSFVQVSIVDNVLSISDKSFFMT